MAGQNGNGGSSPPGQRKLILPPEPVAPARRRLESRVPTLQPPAPPAPLTAPPAPRSLERPSTLAHGRRITRLSEYLASLEKKPGPKQVPQPTAASSVPTGLPSRPSSITDKMLWDEMGLPFPWQQRMRLKRKEPETPDIKKSLDVWFNGLNHPAKEVLLNSFIESAMDGLSVLRKAPPGESSLGMVCSGGRAPYLNESEVGSQVATVSDNFLRLVGELKSAGAMTEEEAADFTARLVRSILSTAPPSEGEAKGELDVRNGFLRACAWCICACTDPRLLSGFLDKGEISLADGVGIAAGLGTDKARNVLGDEEVRTMLYRLIEKRWVSTGFEHLKEMLRKDTMDRKLNVQDVSRFVVLLLKEAGEYQKIAQYCSTLARNVGLISQDRAKANNPIYLDDRSFYLILRTRTRADSPIWKNAGLLHEFVAQKMRHGVSEGSGAPAYAVGRRPREITQLFTTILESLDFLSGNEPIREMALTALERYDFAAPPTEGLYKDSEAFKKVFALCLFSSYEHTDRYRNLLESLRSIRNPIISNLVDEHLDDLATGRLSRTILPRLPDAPAANIDDSDSPF
ncbi:MAG: hypothetical protein WC350_01990 [Candidatus Micrarchaeia archaeon]